MPRSQSEIESEIVALRALIPVGVWSGHTKSKIDAAIEELEIGVDDTAFEWTELSSGEQEIIIAARDWKNGDSDARPSEGWGGLVV